VEDGERIYTPDIAKRRERLTLRYCDAIQPSLAKRAQTLYPLCHTSLKTRISIPSIQPYIQASLTSPLHHLDTTVSAVATPVRKSEVTFQFAYII
jgi:hypothetical protein